MVDSESVVKGCELAAGLAEQPVEPTAGGEGEQALRDARDESFERARVVALERELPLGCLDDRFDPLTNAAERSEAGLLVLAVGAQQLAAEGGDELLELLAGETL